MAYTDSAREYIWRTNDIPLWFLSAIGNVVSNVIARLIALNSAAADLHRARFVPIPK